MRYHRFHVRPRFGARSPQAPPEARPQPAPLAISTGRSYGSGYDDATLDAIVARLAGTSVHDNDIWGPNADQLHLLHDLIAAGEVNASLIGHETRRALVAVYGELDEWVPRAIDSEQQAIEDIDDHLLAAVEQEERRQKIKNEGLAFPHWIAHSLLYGLALLGLVVGDLTFIATAFQLFGLSDAELFGFVPFSDQLHIAASASVGALVVLAHVGGKRLREIFHDLDRRRKERDERARAQLAPPSRPSALVALACIAAAMGLLFGIAMVRTGYLEATGVSTQAWSFALIQAGVFVAALALAIAHAHPHGREWVDLSRRVAKAAKRMQASCALHVEAVARANHLIDQGNAILAQAGHHLLASRSEVIRQCARVGWTMPLYQPEPVSEHRLLPDSLPRPVQATKVELAEFLIGITRLPAIEKLSTRSVTERRQQARAAIERVRMSRVERLWPTSPEAPAGAATADDADPVTSAVGVELSEAMTPAAVASTNGGTSL